MKHDPQSIARRWNEEHPVGTEVSFERGGRKYKAAVAGPARVERDQVVVPLGNGIFPRPIEGLT